MGLIDDIKSDVKKSGTNKGQFLYFKSGSKLRVRFLDDMDDGHKIKFHDSFTDGVNVPCQENFGKECSYCENDELRTRDQYAWSVWDYESKAVKILMAPVNQCSPVPAIVALFDSYGTLIDRDYVITKAGAQQSTTYSVVPMDKAKFRNEKAKPFSETKFLKMLDKAFPDDENPSDDDDDEDEKPAKGKKKQGKPAPAKGKKKPAPEPEEDDDDDDEEDEDGTDYTSMSAKELYKLCKERDIEVLPKKLEKYYIKQLEEDDAKSDDGWDDEDSDDDEWGE